MAQDTPTITAEPRERVGSRYSQRLRQNGRLPAVIYGHQTDPLAVSVGQATHQAGVYLDKHDVRESPWCLY